MKRAVTILLLLFVAAAVAWEFAGPDQSKAQTDPCAAEPAPVEGRKLIAYYFYGDRRCATCIKIENYAREALEKAFPAAFRSGELEWREVNYERPENEHFAEEYELVSSSLVLVDTVDGKQRAWRNLDEVWDRIRDEADFRSYVVEQTRSFLGHDS